MAFVFFLLLIPNLLFSHPSHNSSIELDVRTRSIIAKITIPIQDLQIQSNLPLSDSSEEWLSHHEETLQRYFLENTILRTNQVKWDQVFQNKLLIEKKEDSENAVGVIEFLNPSSERPESIELELLFSDKIPGNNKFLVFLRTHWQTGVDSENPVLLDELDKTNHKTKIHLGNGNDWIGIKHTIQMGMRHILEGYDHMLFLIMLILTAPLHPRGNHWEINTNNKESFIKIIKIISFFTLGHSVTLLLGGFQFIPMPLAWIEILIAISVLISAIHVILPIFPLKEYGIAGVFGLIHGFAFSSTITEFGLDTNQLILSILSFNLGIEIMQICLVLLFLPFLFALIRFSYFGTLRIILGGCGCLISLYWILDRLLLII